jgi:hypothetical protein
MNFIIKLKSLHKREDTRPYILFIKTRRPWRTTLHLHSTSLESFTKEREATSWWFRRSPPCIYRCGTAPCGRQSRWSSLERTLRRAVEATRGRLSRLVTKLVRPALVPLVDDSTEVNSVCLGSGPSNPYGCCMAAHDWLRLFSLDQKVCFLLYFQLNSCIHKFLQGHVECRDFISRMCIRNASSSLFCDQIDAHFWSLSINNAMTPFIEFPSQKYMHRWHEGSLIFHNPVKQENGRTVIYTSLNEIHILAFRNMSGLI